MNTGLLVHSGSPQVELDLPEVNWDIDFHSPHHGCGEGEVKEVEVEDDDAGVPHEAPQLDEEQYDGGDDCHAQHGGDEPRHEVDARPQPHHAQNLWAESAELCILNSFLLKKQLKRYVFLQNI